MPKTFKPIKSPSKSTEVFHTLRDAILAGELQPGDSLKEAHLARQLHVSQVPVREALLHLEHLGLVVRVQDKGTTVTKLSRSQMIELLEVRAELEDLAFRLAAPRLTEKAISELEACAADIEKKIAQKSYFEVAEADLRFHQTVWKYAGNRALQDTLERLCISILAFVSLQRRTAREPLPVRRHQALIEVLRQGKAKSISAAIREHLDPRYTIPSSVID